eukprot:357798-Chlamydomonas_euryale.AAC.5
MMRGNFVGSPGRVKHLRPRAALWTRAQINPGRVLARIPACTAAMPTCPSVCMHACMRATFGG